MATVIDGRNTTIRTILLTLHPRRVNIKSTTWRYQSQACDETFSEGLLGSFWIHLYEKIIMYTWWM